MNDESLLKRDGPDLVDLLSLEAASPWCFRSRRGEPNENGRTFGGQLIGQALMAAARTAPQDRAPTAIQFLFLQGAWHDQPIEYRVTALQDGKRFCARNVRGAQANARLVCDAQVTFALPLEAPSHMAAPKSQAWLAADPNSLPRLVDLPAALAVGAERALGYKFRESELVDLRIADLTEGAMSRQPTPQLRFWIKTRRSLPDDPLLHAAAFAYLSDWWLNFSAAGVHIPQLIAAERSLYVASLNHSIWFHRPLRADQWLHFDTVSPSAAAGRGFTTGRVHDRDGRLVASVAQESLMAPAAG